MKRVSTTLIYVLSSISILCCCLFGLGILLALPSFIIANNKLKEIESNPENYDSEDIIAMKNARTFALVTLVINGLWFLYNAYSLATTDWDTFMEEFKSKMEQYQQ